MNFFGRAASAWLVPAKYLELARARVALMVLAAAANGWLLAGGGLARRERFFWMLLGTALASGGAGALNGVIEREADGLMERTKRRPLPAGEIKPANALAFGVSLTLGGCFILLGKVNLLTAFLALMSAFLYVLIYTPMKRLTWMSATVGAIPGAIPALMGWTAARGRLETGAWILFALVFFWQHAHFWTIAWLFQDDYRKAGFRLPPAIERGGDGIFRLIMFAAVALLPVSMLLAVLCGAGTATFFGALALGGGILAAGAVFFIKRSRRAALALLFACGCYLPGLLCVIIIDLLHAAM